MSLSHLTFYRDLGLNSVKLAEKLNIPYHKANRMILGRTFLTVDEYKKLVGEEIYENTNYGKILVKGNEINMQKYLEMKQDFELHSPKRIKIDDTGDIIVYFYPNFYHVTAINNRYDIIWTSKCYDKESAKRLWESEKLKQIL